MKIFCSRCGLAKDIEPTALGAVVTCVGCGHHFSAGPPAGSGATTKVVLIVVAAVVAVPVLVAIIGILAAIAIPNFIRFEARAKQTECKANLKAFVLASRIPFETNGHYTPLFGELGFSPERGNRYAYFAGPGTMEERTAATVSARATDTQVGVDLFKNKGARPLRLEDVPAKLAGDVALGPSGDCPDCSIVAACIGNLDNDATLDVWSVSTRDRHGPGGQSIPAGVPWNDVNDVSE